MIGSIIVKHWLIIPHVQDYRCTKSSLTHERAIEDLGYALYKCKLFFGHKHPDCHTVKVKARTRKTGKGKARTRQGQGKARTRQGQGKDKEDR